MGSERGSRVAPFAPVAALMLLAGAAGYWHAAPRVQVGCALFALPALLALWQQLGRLQQRAAVRAAADDLPAVPDANRAVLDKYLTLEARLEHAPIALFMLDQRDGATPLNANARRLVAPGRATDPAVLYANMALQAAGQRTLMEFETERGLERALVAVSGMALRGEQQRLVALMPVESELEAEALSAWRQLVQVLSHEIMNSLTPVASLSHTAREMVQELRDSLPGGAAEDLGMALDAISRRADSLVEFVASYRSLSMLPEARQERVRVAAVFARLHTLVQADWQARGGDAVFTVEPESLELMVDAGQLEQAMINILKNAFEATAEVARPRVEVAARLSRGARLRIDVLDNGAGVSEEAVPHIFTPFYTTKKKGSGIGLAMVRQLVHGNGGTVRYAKPVGAGARFVITF
jgi:signal transduction histidine kinase